jgi:hypothetical protein
MSASVPSPCDCVSEGAQFNVPPFPGEGEGAQGRIVWETHKDSSAVRYSTILGR